jgi:type I restriction enzyme M protein
MTDTNQKQLGNTLWSIADQLRGAMDADDFRDYMLSFLFLRYLSDNYETAAKKELGKDYPDVGGDARKVPLALWYANNVDDIPAFEKQMRRKVHYVIQPGHLWNSIANLARTQNPELLNTLQAGFKYIETESFESTFQGLFSEIDLSSPKLGKKYEDRNAKLCTIIQKIAEGLAEFSTNIDALGDAYEYLIGQFAAGSGKKAGEFYTPQQISDILSAIVTLDSQEPKTGTKKRLDSVMDFACGSGSLLLNVRKKVNQAGGTIGKIFGQLGLCGHGIPGPKTTGSIRSRPGEHVGKESHPLRRSRTAESTGGHGLGHSHTVQPRNRNGLEQKVAKITK